MEEEKRLGFIFYPGFIEPLKGLDIQIQKNVVFALIQYGIYQEESQGLNEVEKALYGAMKIQIDAQIKKRSKNTTKRGNPNFKKGQTNPYYTEKESEEKTSRGTHLDIKKNEEKTSRGTHLNVEKNDEILKKQKDNSEIIQEIIQDELCAENPSKIDNSDKSDIIPLISISKSISISNNNPPISPLKGGECVFDNLTQITRNVTEYLNEKAGTNYTLNNKNTKRLIQSRLKDGYTVEDIHKVIDKKVKQWKGTEFASNLKFTTLLSGKYFDEYLNQPERIQAKETAISNKNKHGFTERDEDKETKQMLEQFCEI